MWNWLFTTRIVEGENRRGAYYSTLGNLVNYGVEDDPTVKMLLGN